jgi:hypothetical protein
MTARSASGGAALNRPVLNGPVRNRPVRNAGEAR